MLEAREQGRDFGAAPARRIADIICRGRFGQHRSRLRQRRRDDDRCRRACGQGLNHTAAAQAFVDLFGLKLCGHFSLTGEFRQSDSRDDMEDCSNSSRLIADMAYEIATVLLAAPRQVSPRSVWIASAGLCDGLLRRILRRGLLSKSKAPRTSAASSMPRIWPRSPRWAGNVTVSRSMKIEKCGVRVRTEIAIAAHADWTQAAHGFREGRGWRGGAGG